jgi:NAD(P)H-hydrate epimerase
VTQTRFLLTAADVKRVDAAAMAAGLPLEVLMENAGRAVADAIRREHPQPCRAVVVCGKGMNGGDGFVVARHLAGWGFDVRVVALPGAGLARAGSSGVSALMRQALAAWKVAVQDVVPENLNQIAWDVDVVVDAIFGIGFHAPMGELEAQLIRELNAQRAARGFTVWCVDVPSGLTDALEPADDVVQADHTVALTGFKPALMFAPTLECAGKLQLGDVGIPAWITAQHASAEVAEEHVLRTALPERTRNAHKGDAGRVFVLGGCEPYPGAPALTALGAFRAGAGLVTVVSTPTAGLHAPTEATRRTIAAWTRENLVFLTHEKFDVIAAGMGMGAAEPDLLEMLCQLECPVLLDADALQPTLTPFTLARSDRGLQTVLTPHPGEAARMLETNTNAITRDPLEAARALAMRYRAVIVLKGGPSIVSHLEPVQDGKIKTCLWVNTTGNSGMATGGTGDVLAGVIAALIGQGVAVVNAVRLGVYLHGLAGDLAAREFGYGLMASDVALHVPQAWRRLEHPPS